jgi:hypothetical protein
LKKKKRKKREKRKKKKNKIFVLNDSRVKVSAPESGIKKNRRNMAKKNIAIFCE